MPRRAKHICHEFYTFLGPDAFFNVTPFETGPLTTLGDAVKDELDKLENFEIKDCHYPHDPDTGAFYYFQNAAGNSYRSAFPYGVVAKDTDGKPVIPVPRIDMVFRGVTATTYGLEAQWSIKAKLFSLDPIYPNKGIYLILREYVDKGYNEKVCVYASRLFRMFVKDIATSIKANGEEEIVVTAATPDYFLGKSQIPKFPYILRSVVEAERAAWAVQPRTSTSLGYQVIDTGRSGFDPATNDPFAGFAYYVDEFTASVNEILTPHPANEVHIKSDLSVAHALDEMATNHILCNRGFGYASIKAYFNLHIDYLSSPETKLINVEYGPGDVNSAFIEAQKHGNWLYYWDRNSDGWFILSPYNGLYNGDVPPQRIKQGRANNFEMQIAPAARFSPINRVVVEGQWSDAFGGTGYPALDNFTYVPGNKAVYPTGTVSGARPGDDVIFQGYHGIHTAAMAQSEYGRQSSRATFSIKGIPFLGWALARFYGQIYLEYQDGLKLFDYTIPKPFLCNSITITINDEDRPGGGWGSADLSGVEIRTSANGAATDWHKSYPTRNDIPIAETSAST